jgi:hypothetical protein
MSIVQEKFQVTPPQNRNEESSGWVTDRSVRVKKGLPGHEGRSGGDPQSKLTGKALMFNSTPPGMDIEDQELTDQRRLKMTQGGETDVSADYNSGAVKKGYTRRKACPTDDQYTNEHSDAFYGSIKVDGVEGFVERNNMLDRM